MSIFHWISDYKAIQEFETIDILATLAYFKYKVKVSYKYPFNYHLLMIKFIQSLKTFQLKCQKLFPEFLQFIVNLSIAMFFQFFNIDY